MPNRASALLASLAASILLVAAPGAHAQGTCDENTSFVLDWPDIGEVTDLYVTSETNPGRLYTIREQGVNSMLEVADVRSILDTFSLRLPLYASVP